MAVAASDAAPTPTRNHGWSLLALAIGAGLLAYASMRLTRIGGGVASIWLNNGLVAALLLLSGRERWPGLLLASALGQFVARLAIADPPLLAAVVTAINTSEALGVAWWVRRGESELRVSDSLGRVARRALGATVVACLASATLATLASRLRADPPPMLEVQATWVMAHVLGMVVIATLVVCAFQPHVRLLGRPGHRLDYIGCIGLLLATCWLTFVQAKFPLLFLPYLPLLLLAYRHGLAGMVVGTLALAVASSAPALSGGGPFSLVKVHDPLERILFWQFYVACGCLFAYTTTVALAERRRLEARVQRSEARLLEITEHLPAMVAHFDREQRFIYANQRSRDLMQGDPIGRTLREMYGDTVYQNLAAHVAGVLRGQPQSFEGRAWLGERSFDYQAQFVPDLGENGRVVGFYSMTFDVTTAREAERKLASLARHDALTGLASRRHFEEELAQAANRAARGGGALLVLSLDLDHFKDINDQFGHAAGDEVLCEFARRVRDCVYDVDLVGRVGGDEFVVLVEFSASAAVGELIAGRIVAAMSAPMQVNDIELQVATSVGVGLHHPVQSAERVMALADEALYEAKARGRNTWALREG